MARPLKVGLAGLGTVGASVVRLIAQQRADAGARCGRPIEVVAVSRAQPRQGPRHRLCASCAGSPIRWRSRRDPGHRRVRRADRRRGRSGQSRGRGRARRRQVGGHRQQGAARAPRRRARGARREAAASRSISRPRSAAHPDREDAARRRLPAIASRASTASSTAPATTSSPAWSTRSCRSGVPRRRRSGSAMPRPIRPSTSSGHDTAQKLAILASLAFGTRVDPSAIYVEGISSITPADLEAADELGYRIKLLGVAVADRQRHRAARASDHGAEDSAIAQVMGVTNAVTIDADGIAPITLVGPGAGGMATAPRWSPTSPTSPRRARAAVRPAAGQLAASNEGADAAPRGRLLHPPARASTARAPSATIASGLAQQNISLESIVQRHRGAARRRRPKSAPVRFRSS